MAKRPAEENVDGNEAYLKRQKITSTRSVPPAGPPIEIRSGKQLQQVLAFDQDSGRSKQGTYLMPPGNEKIWLVFG
jgi:nucleolar pre-ribosomal-associated protein 1